MSRKSYDYMPGVPAAGHVTAGGFWHPGKADGCPKCADRCPSRHSHSDGGTRVQCSLLEGHTGLHRAGRCSWKEGDQHE